MRMINHVTTGDPAISPGMVKGRYDPKYTVMYMNTTAMSERTAALRFFLYTRYPSVSAIGISIHTGNTAVGYIVKRMPMIMAKIDMTMTRQKNITRRKRILEVGLTMSFVTSPIDLPWLRTEITRAPRSCTAPIKIDPTKTQINAGTHPHITPIAGPTIGPVPAIDVKWCPNRIPFFVGT
jgi:hypothetical protein